MLIRKLIVTNIMIGFLAAFNPIVQCYVRGYVFVDEGILSFSRDDTCLVVKDRELDNKMELYDKEFWVVITIPEDIKGFTSFWYRWGSSNAYINGVPFPVKYGRVIQG